MGKSPLRTRAAVQALLRTCRPAHVAGFVIPIVVDAVDRMLRRWPPPDMREKRGEGFSPFSADGNPAPAVVRESLVLRVVAAFSHALPTQVFSRDAMLPRITMDKAWRMGSDALSRQFTAKTAATARRRFVVEQRIDADGFLASAIAVTQPALLALRIETEHDPAAEASPRQVRLNPLRHNSAFYCGQGPN